MIRKLYDEAQAIFARSRRASGALREQMLDQAYSKAASAAYLARRDEDDELEPEIGDLIEQIMLAQEEQAQRRVMR